MPPDKIFPRSYMDFEQKYQKDPGMNRVNQDAGVGAIMRMMRLMMMMIDYFQTVIPEI